MGLGRAGLGIAEFMANTEQNPACGVALFHPTRPCAALSGAALIFRVRPRLFNTARPCLVCTNNVNGYFIMDNSLSEFKLYSSDQQNENKNNGASFILHTLCEWRPQRLNRKNMSD